MLNYIEMDYIISRETIGDIYICIQGKKGIYIVTFIAIYKNAKI